MHETEERKDRARFTHYTHLNTENKAHALTPVALEHGERSGHDVIARVLGGTVEGLLAEEVELTTEGLADDAGLRGVALLLGDQRDLEKHRAGIVRALEELGVDVHVEGSLFFCCCFCFKKVDKRKSEKEWERETERQTETETDRDRDRQRQRQRQ